MLPCNTNWSISFDSKACQHFLETNLIKFRDFLDFAMFHSVSCLGTSGTDMINFTSICKTFDIQDGLS